MSKVISLDLEMNQPSGKIIQIGYVIGDVTNLRIFEKRSLIVDPKEPLGEIDQPGLKISIEDFTGITEDRIRKEGITLQSAYQILVDDVVKHNPTRTVVQWGDGSFDNKGDHDYLRQELNLSWDDFIFRPRSWDVKSFYQIYRTFNRQSVVNGVENALKNLNLTFQGRPHDALDDAFNTFIIFSKLGEKMTLSDKIIKLVK